MDPNRGVVGFVWEATKDSQTVYLSGSLHKGFSEIPTSLVEVIGKVKQVYFERKLSTMSNFYMGLKMGASTTYKVLMLEGPTEEEREKAPDQIFSAISSTFEEISEDDKQQIRQSIEDGTNIPALVALTALSHLVDKETSSEGGLEASLLPVCRQKRKKIYGLEKPKYHAKLLGNEYIRNIERIQEAMKKDQLSDFFKKHKRFHQEIKEAYREGNLERARKAMEELETDTTTVLEVPERNQNLAERIDTIAKKPSLIVNGIFHFTGEQSILKLLEDRGWKIKQLGI